jgi:hypothetical protein
MLHPRDETDAQAVCTTLMYKTAVQDGCTRRLYATWACWIELLLDTAKSSVGAGQAILGMRPGHRRDQAAESVATPQVQVGL